MAGGFAVHADHEAARNDAGETDGLDPRPDFVPTGCPKCHRLTGNAFKRPRTQFRSAFAVLGLIPTSGVVGPSEAWSNLQRSFQPSARGSNPSPVHADGLLIFMN